MNLAWDNRKEQVRCLLETAKSYSEVLRELGIPHGGNIATLKKYIRRWEFSFKEYHGCKHGSPSTRSLRLEECLREDATCTQKTLKGKILSERLLEPRCFKCGLGPEWDGSSLVLILDHINGKRKDNRLENLRFVCPNCNSQLDTFAGRNNRVEGRTRKKRLWSKRPPRNNNLPRPKITHQCLSCGITVGQKGRRCRACYNVFQQRCKRPSVVELDQLLWQMPTTDIAQRYGVSERAIRNWMEGYGLKGRGKGYWRWRGKQNRGLHHPGTVASESLRGSTPLLSAE